MLRYILLLLALSVGVTHTAHAHPHVFVTASAELEVEDGALARITQSWRFDLFFSQVLISDFDQNRSGTLEGIEVEQMSEIVFGSLKDYSYFTWLTVADGYQTFGDATDIEVVVEDGELLFNFSVPLAEPMDMRGKAAVLSLYDPTIYVDVYVPDDGFSLRGAAGDQCQFGYGQGEELSTIDGFLTPQIIKLECATGGS